MFLIELTILQCQHLITEARNHANPSGHFLAASVTDFSVFSETILRSSLPIIPESLFRLKIAAEFYDGMARS